MNCKKISAIIRTSALGQVQARLKEVGVKGLSVFPVLGFGEYVADWTFHPHQLVQHMKLEIWAHDEMVDQIVSAILDAARTGLPGDGMVTVLPVDKVWRVRTHQEATADEL